MLLKPERLSWFMNLCCMPALINLEVDDSFDLGMNLPIHVTNAELKLTKPHSFFWTALEQTLGIQTLGNYYNFWHAALLSYGSKKKIIFGPQNLVLQLETNVWVTIKPGHIRKWSPHYFSLWKYLGHIVVSFCFPGNSSWLYLKFVIRPKIGICHLPFISSFISFTSNLISGTKCN